MWGRVRGQWQCLRGTSIFAVCPLRPTIRSNSSVGGSKPKSSDRAACSNPTQNHERPTCHVSVSQLVGGSASQLVEVDPQEASSSHLRGGVHVVMKPLFDRLPFSASATALLNTTPDLHWGSCGTVWHPQRQRRHPSQASLHFEELLRATVRAEVPSGCLGPRTWIRR